MCRVVRTPQCVPYLAIAIRHLKWCLRSRSYIATSGSIDTIGVLHVSCHFTTLEPKTHTDLSAARAPLVVGNSCCFSFVFFNWIYQTCSLTWPLRHVWKIGFNWCHILFGKKAHANRLKHGVFWSPFQCPSAEWVGGAGDHYVTDGFGLSFFIHGVWDERPCCSNIFVFVSSRFQIPRGIL